MGEVGGAGSERLMWVELLVHALCRNSALAQKIKQLHASYDHGGKEIHSYLLVMLYLQILNFKL